MGLMLLKKFTLLFLLISGSLLSTSFAGGRSKFIRNLAAEVNEVQEETPRKPLNNEEVRTIHERLLRTLAKDYGRYDPSPALSKPPFKLIPN
ncbi:protein CASPARIAN STRIP INTEGRITY FACTOR 1-like [Gastrolobium bilobum]|uniref:protein CASPARIAN STRIP INTEGRITY FACTOR 1-like n=1 Tax=Gastrolobium bilobum TaxID=150636 RepID=UPI002AB1B25D|nr:protein CASPARIAN STRIP INTEGRITY FACTOR 1-like [Gastrolobium bilobum]